MRWVGACAASVAYAVASCATPDRETERAHAPRFVFQNSLCVNLHHFLRAEARRQARGATLALPLDGLTPAERAVWTEGLAAYRELSQQSLLFDEELVAIGVELAGAGARELLPPELLPAGLARALNGAAPVYRARVWPAVGSSRVDLQACKLEYSIVSPK